MDQPMPFERQLKVLENQYSCGLVGIYSTDFAFLSVFQELAFAQPHAMEGGIQAVTGPPPVM